MTKPGSARSLAAAAAAAFLPVCLLGGPFVEARPNRVLAGTSLPLHLVSPGWFALLAAAAALMAAAAAVRGGGALRPAARAALGSAAAVGLVAAAGAAGTLLTRGPGAYGRVSLGAGFWAALFCCYCYVYLASLGLDEKPFLRTAGLLLAPAGAGLLLFLGLLDDLSLVQEFFVRRETFFRELHRHAALAFGATALGTVVGIPLGAVSRFRPGSEKYLFFGVNLAQTVPTLSLLGLLILPLSLLREKIPALESLGVGGTGWAPALIVLFLYVLLPVAGNTLAGLRSVDPAVVEAARGMGMSSRRIFLTVEFPLSLPVIFSGMRTALTQSMGNAILAGLIGGGGMGAIIFLGLAQAASDLVLLGALPVALSALLADRLMHHLGGFLQRGRFRGRRRRP